MMVMSTAMTIAFGGKGGGEEEYAEEDTHDNYADGC